MAIEFVSDEEYFRLANRFRSRLLGSLVGSPVFIPPNRSAGRVSGGIKGRSVQRKARKGRRPLPTKYANR